MRDQFNWARILSFVTGLVNQELLLQNEYLTAENRILRAHLPARPLCLAKTLSTFKINNVAPCFSQAIRDTSPSC
jgi:hypothetical protein